MGRHVYHADASTGRPVAEPLLPLQKKRTPMNLASTPAASPAIHNVLYCSHATSVMTNEELARIVRTSQQNNPRRGITGLLVYGGGMFLQWLEGPREAVEALMSTLSTDPRHETIVRLQVLDGLKERLYPKWAMQNVAPREIREILIDCLSRARTEGHAHVISLMIELLETDQLAPLKPQALTSL
jgi:hypothetical protein